MAKNTKWDDESNEAVNSFVSWGMVDDYILGTLIGVRHVKSTLPGKEGQMQNIYDFKVKECSYHVLDSKKKLVEEPVVPNEGDIVSVGGRSSIDTRMARAKIGQVIGLKFVAEIESKTKGFNPTKSIKVYMPKLANGDFEMDEQAADKDF